MNDTENKSTETENILVSESNQPIKMTIWLSGNEQTLCLDTKFSKQFMGLFLELDECRKAMADDIFTLIRMAAKQNPEKWNKLIGAK